MPHHAPLPDLLERLSADPTVGLSPKEAAKRLENSTAAPLFRKSPRRYAECVRKTIREPALWLMLAVAIIALFFDRVALGIFCLLLTAGNTALSAYFLYRADRTDDAMLAYDTPLCRVLRGGRVLRVTADGLVPGDIILIHAGDIIPADCRLIRTDGFAVLEREMDASDPLRPPVRLEKDAGRIPEDADGLRHSPVNMAFAGGMADSGSALAVVVATGSETHLGGLIGRVPTPHQGRGAEYFRKNIGFLSVYNLCLLCFVIPLTAVGIFTVGDDYEFLDIFLSALALASLTLTEHMLARGVHLAAATRRAAALDRDGENTAEIKSAATLETLTAMTDLLLVGTAALHDGRRHPRTLYVGDHVYHCDRPEADDEVRSVAEYLYLYREGASALPAIGGGDDDFSDLLTAFCEWAEVDTDALRIKIKEIHPRGAGVAGIFPTAYGNRRVTVRLTHRFDEAEACTLIYDGDKPCPLDRAGKDALYRIYREESRQGSIPLFLLTESEGEWMVRALLTYAPRVCRKTVGAVKNLESAGIRVTAFMRDVSEVHPFVLSACGLTETAPSDLPPPSGMPRTPAATRIAEGCRAFEGCTTSYISNCIADLKAQGRTVGVLSVDGEDVSLLAEADVAFTCAPSLYVTAEGGEASAPETDIGPDGSPNGRVADDRSRRTAHVVVRRCSEVGGGVLGVLRALQAADAFRGALDRTLRFVLISQVIRIVMTVLPLCLGLAIAAAPALLISGLFVDLLIMTAALGTPAASAPAPRRKSDTPFVRSPRAHLTELIAAVIGAVVPWIVAGIAALVDVEFGGDLLYYGMLCTVGLQLAVFRTERLPKRDSTVFLTTFGLILVFVGALAAALVGDLHPLWTLALPLTAPVGYLLSHAIAHTITVVRKRAAELASI